MRHPQSNEPVPCTSKNGRNSRHQLYALAVHSDSGRMRLGQRLTAARRWSPVSYPQAVLVPAGAFACTALVLYGLDLAAGWPARPAQILMPAGCSVVVSVWEAIPAVRRRRRRVSAEPDLAGRSPAAPPGIPGDVYELVCQDRKILAIRRYRQLNRHLSLKEAKDVIDGI
jgi:hypothetical protein